MRVVHLSLHRDPAGRRARDLLAAWPTLAEHAPAIARAGVHVEVLHAGAHDETVEHGGVRYVFDRSSRVLRQRLRRAQADVVHAHGLIHAVRLWSMRRGLGHTPFLVQDHGARPITGIRAWLWRHALAGAAVAFTTAEQAAAYGRGGALRPDQRVFAVPVASSTFTPGDRAAARRRTGITGHPAALWLGRLDANKDPFTILDAVARASTLVPTLALWMAWTSGALEGAVRRRVADDPRLADRVHLLGRLPHADVEPWLRAADVLVQGSHHESGGYAVIEALACGTPVIVSDIPSFRALTGAGAVGRLIPVDDARGFAEALMEGPRVTREAVRAHFDAHLAWDVIGRQWRACYQQMAAQ